MTFYTFFKIKNKRKENKKTKHSLSKKIKVLCHKEFFHGRKPTDCNKYCLLLDLDYM